MTDVWSRVLTCRAEKPLSRYEWRSSLKLRHAARQSCYFVVSVWDWMSRHCLQFERELVTTWAGEGRQCACVCTSMIGTCQTLGSDWLCWSRGLDSCKSNWDFSTADLYLILLPDRNDSFSQYNRKLQTTTSIPARYKNTARLIQFNNLTCFCHKESTVIL